jgi:uncharacterized protein (TIGR03435 family)
VGVGLHFDGCSGDRYMSSGLIFGNVLQWTFELQGSAGTEFLRSIPESIRQNFYDIQAKATAPITSESQCRLMVQALLADRFSWPHYEEREAELFDLVVARGGPKMRKVLPTDEGTDINFVVNGRLLYTEAPIRDADERAHTNGMIMQELAQRLPTTAPRPKSRFTPGGFCRSVRLPNWAKFPVTPLPIRSASAAFPAFTQSKIWRKT